MRFRIALKAISCSFSVAITLLCPSGRPAATHHSHPREATYRTIVFILPEHHPITRHSNASPLPQPAPAPAVTPTAQPAQAQSAQAQPAPTTPPAPAPAVIPTAQPAPTTPAPLTNGVSAVVFAEWSRVNTCEEGGVWASSGPAYPDGLGISAVNWAAYGGGANLSPAAQIAVAQRIEAAGGMPGHVPDQHGCAGW